VEPMCGTDGLETTPSVSFYLSPSSLKIN
jgi:hypothetical protein